MKTNNQSLARALEDGDDSAATEIYFSLTSKDDKKIVHQHYLNKLEKCADPVAELIKLINCNTQYTLWGPLASWGLLETLDKRSVRHRLPEIIHAFGQGHIMMQNDVSVKTHLLRLVYASIYSLPYAAKKYHWKEENYEFEKSFINLINATAKELIKNYYFEVPSTLQPGKIIGFFIRSYYGEFPLKNAWRGLSKYQEFKGDDIRNNGISFYTTLEEGEFLEAAGDIYIPFLDYDFKDTKGSLIPYQT